MEEARVGDVIREGPWAGFTLVSRYTRAEAIADGVLADISEAAREAGFSVPLAVASAIWSLVEPTTQEAKEWGQDRAGRLWDLLRTARHAIAVSDRSGRELRFCCLFQLRGREHHRNGLQKLAFKLHSGPGDQAEQVLTIMLPEED